MWWGEGLAGLGTSPCGKPPKPSQGAAGRTLLHRGWGAEAQRGQVFCCKPPSPPPVGLGETLTLLPSVHSEGESPPSRPHRAPPRAGAGGPARWRGQQRQGSREQRQKLRKCRDGAWWAPTPYLWTQRLDAVGPARAAQFSWGPGTVQWETGLGGLLGCLSLGAAGDVAARPPWWRGPWAAGCGNREGQGPVAGPGA